MSDDELTPPPEPAAAGSSEPLEPAAGSPEPVEPAAAGSPEPRDPDPGDPEPREPALGPGRSRRLGRTEAALDPADAAFAERLYAARPLPAASFRGELGRHLRAEDPGHGPRPRYLWTASLLLLGLGLLVMVYGLLQSLGRL